MKKLLLSLTFLIQATSNVNVTVEASSTDEKYTNALLDWLRAEDGYFNPKLEMRPLDPNDNTSRFGMFANTKISTDEQLIRVPTTIILRGDEQPTYSGMECSTVRKLARELRLGEESKYAPYVNYLKETQPPGQLPSAWSDAGKALLWRTITSTRSGTGRGRQVLPPEDPTGWLEHEWYGDCRGSTDPMEEYAALLVVQRSWDHLLLPVYDMMSHRNGKWLNTKSNSVHDEVGQGQPVEVRALRDINAGEEIYTTYNLCDDCEQRHFNFGTPEILRDYGFVENFPQSWIFPDVNVAFRIDAKIDNGDDTTTSNVEDYALTEWIGGIPQQDGINMFKERLEHVIDTKRIVAFRDPKVPANEWEIIRDYIYAMELAMKVALDAYKKGENGDAICMENGDCGFSLERYTNLDVEHVSVTSQEYTCDVRKTFGSMDKTFEVLEEFKSPYQKIGFMMDPKNRDTCMDLDEIVQICDSYRPHYHEMVVHNTARFRDRIERVLFVGGGDSMLLHEILQYPALEIVVGLELDQRVTRGAFKHFGTQPHFDDERVQWWYGDASKSLLMLPKSYFKSFDMVLVDLSETVMSFKVTEGLDVLEALTLLLKDDGIFVKNEVYFEKFKEMFPYSAQIHWYDNPVICSQLLALGSRSVDFMNHPLTDHDVDGLFIRPLDEIEDQYDLYHDYAKNTTSRQLCEIMNEKNPSNEQLSSPGIILIVEAEETTVDMTDPTLTMEILSDALAQRGLSVVSKSAKGSGTNIIISITLQEGYVIARVNNEMKYCGFDIHFWSSFDKHEDAKSALVAAVGGGEISSYRIIAGGQFGVPTWNVDEKSRGPQFDQLCKEYTNTVHKDDNSMPDVATQDFVDKVMVESLKMINNDNLKVALFVGNGSSHAAEKNKNKMEQMEGIDEVINISCPSMEKFNEFSEDASEALTLCEKNILAAMSDTSVKKFDAIIIDSIAGKITTSIFLKVFTARREHLLENALEPNALVLSVLAADEEDWRRNLVRLFKDQVFVDEPSCYSEVLFYDDGSTIKLLLTVDGEKNFFEKLNTTISNFSDKNEITSEVQIVSGGMFKFQEDFVPSNHFLPDDYDQTLPLQQWNSQKPLGYQVVFQMEPSKNIKLSCAVVRGGLEYAIAKAKFFGSRELEVFEEYSQLGDGCLLVTYIAEASIAVLWDGRNHIDINYFTFDEDVDMANAFEKAFQVKVKSLSTVLRDEQPRGIGKVVSYRRDIKDGSIPHWA